MTGPDGRGTKPEVSWALNFGEMNQRGHVEPWQVEWTKPCGFFWWLIFDPYLIGFSDTCFLSNPVTANSEAWSSSAIFRVRLAPPASVAQTRVSSRRKPDPGRPRRAELEFRGSPASGLTFTFGGTHLPYVSQVSNNLQVH